MEKFDLRKRIRIDHFIGHYIIPAVMKALMEKTKGLEMSIVRRSPTEAEVTATDREKREWRYPVDLEKWTCSKQWQVTGKPCIHALFFITSLRGDANAIDKYVHKYYSVEMFRATYAENLPALEGKQQWDIVDPGFKLCAPVQKQAPGRPRKQRIRASSEGKGLGPRKKKCKRCGRCGHQAKGCTRSVDPAFGEEEHWGAQNADDHPTADEPAIVEVQDEDEDQPIPDVVQHEMRPPREPSHEASTQASVVRYVQFSHPFLFMHTLQFVTYLQFLALGKTIKSSRERSFSKVCEREERWRCTTSNYIVSYWKQC